MEKDSSVKTEYEIGDAFDFTGLSAKIKYNDGSESKVSLTKVNATVVGFKAGEAGSCTVTFIYKGKDVDGSLSVTVKVSSKEYKRLLEEGVELLINQQYDEGIAKIRAAYEKEQNDETKMYYALSELALISTDESVANIVRNNFGITNYPATLNALINGEWLKEYKRSRKLNDNWNLEASYTYVRVRNDNNDGKGYVRDNNYIPNMYRFGVRYHDDLWNADLFLRGGSGADTSGANDWYGNYTQKYVDSNYVTLDMSVSYKASKDLSFYAKGYNLLNKAYAESAGAVNYAYSYPAQGRRFIIGAEYTF